MGADAVGASATAFQDLCLRYQAARAWTRFSSQRKRRAAIRSIWRARLRATAQLLWQWERLASILNEKRITRRSWIFASRVRNTGPGRYDTAYEQKGRDYPIGYVRWTETRNMDAFIRLLADGKIKIAPLITHRFPIDRAQLAYELISGKSHEAFLGVVIQYSGQVSESRTLALVPNADLPQAGVRVPASRLSIGLLGAGVYASNTLIPALKASRDTSLLRSVLHLGHTRSMPRRSSAFASVRRTRCS